MPLQAGLTSTRKVNFAYNDDDVLTTRTLTTNTPVAESFVYDDNGLVSSHTVTHGEDVDAYSYTYDDDGNITEIKKGGATQQGYVYDANNQLIRENNIDTGKTIVYTYDNGGNILSKNEYAYTLGDLGAVVDTVNYSYDTAWKDKLVSYDGQSITYDEIGNPTNYMGAQMTWFARQMQSYTKGNTSITYKYDSDGLRTQKVINGVKHEYYYVDGKLQFEKKGDEYQIYYRYDSNGRPALAVKHDISQAKNYYYYLITNTRGDVIETRNGDGNVNAKFTYDAWGKLVSVTDANGNALSQDSFAYQISLKYRGYVYDNETGLYYLQSRYYDPNTGRFINADAVDYIGYSGEVLSYNVFAYCENDPVNGEDPWGLFKKRDHFDETRIIAEKYFSKDIANALGEASASVDDIYSPTKKFYSSYNQSFHFNTNSVTKKTDSRQDRSEELFKEGVSCLARAKKYNNLYKKHSSNNNYRANFVANLTLSVVYFGMSIHPLQDQVAHSGIGGDIPLGISFGSGSIFVFHFHWPWGVDELDKPYPKDKNKKKRDVNTEVTTKQIKRIANMYKKYGLYSYVK